MKALHRPQPGPAGLDRYAHGRDQWEAVDGNDRAELWSKLGTMQSGLCAYCEGHLATLGQHIDHHWPRSRHPQGTFEWLNLLGSCDRPDSCGHHKDSAAAPTYPCGALVDPSKEDPDAYFVIRDSGRIEPRPGLSNADARKAEQTLDVLNLNLDKPRGGRSLCAERRRALQFYLRTEPDILAILEAFLPEERAALVEREIAEACTTPFGSIIRHFFRQADR